MALDTPGWEVQYAGCFGQDPRRTASLYKTGIGEGSSNLAQGEGHDGELCEKKNDPAFAQKRYDAKAISALLEDVHPQWATNPPEC
jgi:hypothetical protein